MRTLDLWLEIGESLLTVLAATDQGFSQMYPDGWIALTGVPIGAMNMAYIGLGDDPVLRFEEFAAEAGKRNLPLKIYCDSECQAEIGEKLLTRGHEPKSRVPLMSLEISRFAKTSLPHSFAIEDIVDAESLDGAVQVMSEVFQLPIEAVRLLASPGILSHAGVRYLRALEAGQLCSVATLARNGGTVGIWNMATAATKRRRGAAFALLETALQQEIDLGAERFLLLASTEGKPLYERLGFETADIASIYRISQTT